ncbi:flagellin [Thiohalobacter sp. IOR34]|uniref:flagellin N-terminal helical domain-containing protein n=1 Tax=Thiohalobacter sp. IOR34 TaxID=3057176 RepID=UPI0025B135D1|nr:flagellin [Thiohalobacter sp. IOR34]WJW74585.1 flagellin [Thiohalobacter sp. IOR34]
MAQVINTNIMSLNSQRALNRSQSNLQTSLQRLSSGLRINSAKDDAAGLAIATGLTKQIRGFNQAIRNANDGVSLAQTAEGALDEITNMVQRVRELAVQAANGNYTSTERSALNKEVNQLRQEISRIADAVTFNGVKVIGSTAVAKFWVGNGTGSAANAIAISFKDITGTSGITSFITNANVTTVSDALSTITVADTALTRINAIRADLGAKQNRFESTVRSLQNAVENLSASRSRVQDADFAMETANLTRAQILQQAGTAMLAQANAVPQNVLSLLR